jgi:hypothetical protein
MTREFPNNLYVTGTLINTTGVISGAGTAYHSGHLSSPPVISGVRVTRSLVLYVCFVYRCLSFCTLSVLLRYTDSDCPFVFYTKSSFVSFSCRIRQYFCLCRTCAFPSTNNFAHAQMLYQIGSRNIWILYGSTLNSLMDTRKSKSDVFHSF